MKKLFFGVLLLVGLFMFACGADPQTEIKNLVGDMEKAIKAGDAKKVKELTGEEMDEEAMKAAKESLVSYEVSDIKVDGDKATAKIKITMKIDDKEETKDQDAEFEKVDGKWKVAKKKIEKPK